MIGWRPHLWEIRDPASELLSLILRMCKVWDGIFLQKDHYLLWTRFSWAVQVRGYIRICSQAQQFCVTTGLFDNNQDTISSLVWIPLLFPPLKHRINLIVSADQDKKLSLLLNHFSHTWQFHSVQFGMECNLFCKITVWLLNVTLENFGLLISKHIFSVQQKSTNPPPLTMNLIFHTNFPAFSGQVMLQQTSVSIVAYRSSSGFRWVTRGPCCTHLPTSAVVKWVHK